MNSHTPSLTELEIRLGKLERQNRRWKYLGFLLLLLAGTGFLLAQAPRKRPSAASAPATPAAAYDTLQVHRLELRDKAGNLRGVWTVVGEAPGLALFDITGKIRALLTIWAEGPRLVLSDAAENPRAELRVEAKAPVLALLDTAGKHRAALALTAEGPTLTLADTAGKPRVWLGLGAEGPALTLADTAGKPRAQLQEDSLFLQDAQQFKAVVGVTGTKVINTGESRTTSAAAVTLFGKDGKVIWQVP